MGTFYNENDWRNYLEHSSKYDWSTGKNPPDYNHDYVMDLRKKGKG